MTDEELNERCLKALKDAAAKGGHELPPIDRVVIEAERQGPPAPDADAPRPHG